MRRHTSRTQLSGGHFAFTTHTHTAEVNDDSGATIGVSRKSAKANDEERRTLSAILRRNKEIYFNVDLCCWMSDDSSNTTTLIADRSVRLRRVRRCCVVGRFTFLPSNFFFFLVVWFVSSKLLCLWLCLWLVAIWLWLVLCLCFACGGVGCGGVCF